MGARCHRNRGCRVAAIVVFSFVLFVSCKPQAQESASDDSPVAVEDVTVPTESVGFRVSVVKDNRFSYLMHEQSSHLAECVVYPDSTNKDITCLMDAQELDLHYFGATLRYNVPPSMCTYHRFASYYYYGLEVGTGPSLIRYHVDKDGNVCNDTNGDGDCAGEPAAANVAGGVPYCAYDYSPFGPNCCLGSYTLITIPWDAGANNGAGAYGQAEVSQNDWGGRASACLAGPAMDGPLAPSGYPMPTIAYVEGTGLNEDYTIKSPLEGMKGSNVFIANFFATADHGGNIPLAMRSPPTASYLPATNPYYEFTCYDRAREINARIRVMIREWNLASQYQTYVNTGTGNPDSTGNEAGYGTPINDYGDWRDFGNTFPGL